MGDLLQKVQGLEAKLKARVRKVLDTALASRIGDDPAWDALLVSLKLVPLTAAARVEVASQGVPNLKGALPAEVRKALLVVARETDRERQVLVGALAGAADADLAETRLDVLRRELDEVVNRELRDYVAQCRPKTTVSSIFANAQLTTVRYDEAKDGVKTKKCPCCGAARPEGTDLRLCAFCGNDFFPGALAR